ncbi:hypothetical protein ACOMHN_051952 [Nucella lapillus]
MSHSHHCVASVSMFHIIIVYPSVSMSNSHQCVALYVHVPQRMRGQKSQAGEARRGEVSYDRRCGNTLWEHTAGDESPRPGCPSAVTRHCLLCRERHAKKLTHFHTTCLKTGSHFHTTCLKTGSHFHTTCLKTGSHFHTTCLKTGSTTPRSSPVRACRPRWAPRAPVINGSLIGGQVHSG